MRSLDEALEDIGDFGPYQRRVYTLLVFTAIFPVMHKWVWEFTAAVPSYRCKLPFEVAVNASFDAVTFELDGDANATHHEPTGLHLWDQCKQFRGNDTKLSLGQIANSSDEECTAWVYDRSERYNSVVTEFDLVCKRQYYHSLGWILHLGGEIAGFIIWGILSDRFGRKKIFFICLAFQALAGLLSGMVASLTGVLAMRMALGLFSPGCFIGAILRLEFIGPSMRMIAAILDCAVTSLGLIVLAGLAQLFQDWRQLQIVVSFPGFLFLSCWWFVPESARWYLAQKRERDGRKILSRMANDNKRDLSLDTYEADEPDKGDLVQLNPINLCCFSKTRTRLVLLSFIWFSNSIAFFLMMSMMPAFTDNRVVHYILIALVQLPAFVLSLFTLNRFGKRFPIGFTLIVAGIFVAVIIAVPSDLKYIATTLVILVQICLLSAHAGTYIFSMELQATVIRGASVGINASFRAVGELIIPWVTPLANFWEPLPLTLCASLVALSGFVTFILPETTGHYMPERLQDVEMINIDDDISDYQEQDGSFSIIVPQQQNKEEENNKEMAQLEIPSINTFL